MLQSNVWNIVRGIFAALFAALFCLCFIAASLLSVTAAALSSPKEIAAAVVTEEYVECVLQECENACLDVALLYGVEKDVLLDVLSSSRDLIRTLSLESAESLFEALLEEGEYQASECDPALFLSALQAYVDSLQSNDLQVSVKEGALEEISSDCAKIVTSAAAPISGGALLSVFEAVAGKLPVGLYHALPGISAGAWGAALLFLVCSVLCAGPQRRFLCFVSAFFCAAVLLFVPSFFLLNALSVSSLALSQGVLSFLVSTLVSRFVAPLRVYAAIVFALAVVLLGVCLVLFLRGKKTAFETEASAEDAAGLEE